MIAFNALAGRWIVGPGAGKLTYAQEHNRLPTRLPMRKVAVDDDADGVIARLNALILDRRHEVGNIQVKLFNLADSI